MNEWKSNRRITAALCTTMPKTHETYCTHFVEMCLINLLVRKSSGSLESNTTNCISILLTTVKAYFKGAYSSIQKSLQWSVHIQTYLKKLSHFWSPFLVIPDLSPMYGCSAFGRFNSCRQCLLIYAITVAPLLQFRRSEEHLYITLLLEDHFTGDL